MKVVLSNPSHSEYGVATIPFPIPKTDYAFMVTSGFAELKEYTNGKHGGVYMLFTPVGRLYLKRKIDKRLARKAQGDTQETEE